MLSKQFSGSHFGLPPMSSSAGWPFRARAGELGRIRTGKFIDVERKTVFNIGAVEIRKKLRNASKDLPCTVCESIPLVMITSYFT